ncbi:MAG: hypothetical protein ABIR56_09525 [Polaromonas sp.]
MARKATQACPTRWREKTGWAGVTKGFFEQKLYMVFAPFSGNYTAANISIIIDSASPVPVGCNF